MSLLPEYRRFACRSLEADLCCRKVAGTHLKEQVRADQVVIWAGIGGCSAVVPVVTGDLARKQPVLELDAVTAIMNDQRDARG